MPGADETVETIVAADSWDARVALIRKIPETFGTAHLSAVYSAIARDVFVPHLAPDFAYVHWRDDYELLAIEDAYALAYSSTEGFTRTDLESLTSTLEDAPTALRVFRLFLGFTAQEFASATSLVAARTGVKPLSSGAVKNIESGAPPARAKAAICATVIDETIRGVLFGSAPAPDVRPKTQKPDTIAGWETVQGYATTGVPLPVFLHQRHYGGAFRQLLDATSTQRGNLLEDAVDLLFEDNRVRFIRTGSHNQEEVARRFGLTVKPAPDFVVFDTNDTLRAVLECKGANDGGTARDKASRFHSLRAECGRLGGVPLFAVLAGLGWQRTGDALGPVVRDTDGRVFFLPILREMLTVQPFPDLVGTAPPPA